MRYLILLPSEPTDPRELELKSADQLHETIPVVMDCETEKQAAAFARSKYFDAVAMPVPVPVGSGETILLGFVEDPSRLVDPDAELPFVMFVQCVTQSEVERAQLKKRKGFGFDRALWKIPVCRPQLATIHRVDLRATDLEVPTFTEARVGSHDGKLAIYVEVGGIELSIRFEDPRVQLITAVPDGSEATGTVAADAGPRLSSSDL